MCLLARSRLSDSDREAREYGEGAKEWGRRESERLALPLLSSVSSLFCARAFSIPRARLSRSLEQAISLQLTPTAFFVVIGSLFLNIRLHSILNNKKKKVREEEKS